MRSDLLAGVALSHNEGKMSYELEGERGKVDATLTGVPAVWSLDTGRGVERVGAGRNGLGDAELVDEVGAARTGIEMRMLALGWRKELGDVEGVEWALKGDGFLVEMESEDARLLPGTKSGVQRLRMTVEGGKEWSVGEHGRLRTEMELGGAGTGASGEGLRNGSRGWGEVCGRADGLEVEVEGRYLLAHRSEGFRERGASVAVRYDPGGDGEGMWLGVAPHWGASGSGVESLWGSVPEGEATRPRAGGQWRGGIAAWSRSSWG